MLFNREFAQFNTKMVKLGPSPGAKSRAPNFHFTKSPMMLHFALPCTHDLRIWSYHCVQFCALGCMLLLWAHYDS